MIFYFILFLNSRKMMVGFALCSDLDVEGDLDRYLENPGYAAEHKFDGDRVHIEVTDKRVRIYNRSLSGYTHRLPEIVEEIKTLRLKDVVLDGEVVYLDENGRDDFNMARRRCSVDNKFIISRLSKKYPVTVKVFDLLRMGTSCTELPYLERKTLLAELLRSGERLSPVTHYVKNKRTIWDRSKKEEWEGIVLKKLNSTYQTGRSGNFIRIKNFKETTMTFTQYEISVGGIVLIKGEHRVGVNGKQSIRVKELIDREEYVNANIQYLQKTPNGKLRMPTFRGINEG